MSWIDGLIFGYRQAQQSGVNLPLRSIINFIGTAVDNPSQQRTDVTVGSGGGLTITGSGVVHATAGGVDGAAYVGAASSLLTTNAVASDTAWLAPGSNTQVLTMVAGAPAWAAAPVGGAAATLTFEGQTFRLTAAGSGNGLIQWPQGQATPQIGQAQQANGANPASLTIAPQAPGAAATNSTTGTGGSFIVNLPAGVTGGGDGFVQIQRAGTALWYLGADIGSPSLSGLWYGGSAPTASNYALLVGSASMNVNNSTNIYMQIAAGTSVLSLHSGLAAFFSDTGSSGGGAGVISVANATTSPTSNPSGAGILWEMPTGSAGSAAGTLTHRGLGGAIEQFAAPGTGTINTQLGIKRRRIPFNRPATSSTTTVDTYPMPATAHIATIKFDLTATDTTTLANSAALAVVGTFKNSAGTITQVGSTAVVWGNNTASNIALGFTPSGTNVLLQITTLNNDVYDVTGWIDIYEN